MKVPNMQTIDTYFYCWNKQHNWSQSVECHSKTSREFEARCLEAGWLGVLGQEFSIQEVLRLEFSRL